MTWGVVAGAAITAVAGYASKRSSDKDAEKARKDAGALTAEESKLSMQRTAFENYEGYRYQQLDKRERQRGLDEFRKFNTVQEFAPGYVNETPRVVVPKIIDPITPGMEHKIEAEL